MSKLKQIPLGLLLLAPISSFAEDSVIFAADEADIHAFDKMLQDQKSAPTPPTGKTPFGQAVKDEANLLREQGSKGNAMGAWIRDQRSKSKASVLGNDSSNAGNNSGEVHGAVSDKANAAKGGNGKSFGQGHKK